MQTLDELFEALGGPAKVGRAIGKSTEHAAGMKRRGSIPVDYWPRLIAYASDQGIGGVTYERLVQIHAEPQAVAS